MHLEGGSIFWLLRSASVVLAMLHLLRSHFEELENRRGDLRPVSASLERKFFLFCFGFCFVLSKCAETCRLAVWISTSSAYSFSLPIVSLLRSLLI